MGPGEPVRELIVGHENLDFDALAGCVGLQRLYPDAVIGLPRLLGRDVHSFYALHKDRFPTRRLGSLDTSQVERLIVVDVRDRARLAHIAPLLERLDAGARLDLHVYDHHPSSKSDLVGSVHVVCPLGAVTTSIVERIEAANLSVDREEATLYALGIHADTASLTLSSTTARDARAVAWLIERGASLTMLRKYLNAGFSARQRSALNEVLTKLTRVEIQGASVGVSLIEADHAFDGLAEVTSEACKLEEHGALFVLCDVQGRRLMVVGRSRSPRVDVGQALRALGGGGHPGAGSAILKGVDAETARSTLISALRACVARPRTVGELMSSPVRSLSPKLSLEAARTQLESWEHSGAPVVRNGELFGMLSIRDIERAERAGRADLPVASHMAGSVTTTEEGMPLERALEVMVKKDLGRLPVLRDGRVVGIVSRTDLLRELYPDNAGAEDPP